LLYTDKLGRKHFLLPKDGEHVFVSCRIDEGYTKSGIKLAAHKDFPVTQGFIAELPVDKAYISTYLGSLKMGDWVVFNRYGSGTDMTLVAEDCFYNENLDLFLVDKIFNLHVDDILFRVT